MEHYRAGFKANANTVAFRPTEREDLSVPARKRKKDPGSRLTPALIDAYKVAGYNQTQIAQMHGVTPARVSQIKHEVTGFRQSPRERARAMFPFEVPRPQQQGSVDKRLRDHAEYAVSGGKGMSLDKLKRLGWFYDKLRRENVVVAFDKNTPPSPGIKAGGYSYEHRTTEDGDYIVRFNSDTNLTREQRLLWRFPPKNPEV